MNVACSHNLPHSCFCDTNVVVICYCYMVGGTMIEEDALDLYSCMMKVASSLKSFYVLYSLKKHLYIFLVLSIES